MTTLTNRRKFLGILASALAWFLIPARTQEGDGRKRGRNKRGGGDYMLPSELAAFALLSLVLGRVTDRSVTVSALAAEPMEGFFEYGTSPDERPGIVCPHVVRRGIRQPGFLYLHGR